MVPGLSAPWMCPAGHDIRPAGTLDGAPVRESGSGAVRASFSRRCGVPPRPCHGREEIPDCLPMRRDLALAGSVTSDTPRLGASSSVGQSTRLISVGSEVQVLPGPFSRPVGPGRKIPRRGAGRSAAGRRGAQRRAPCPWPGAVRVSHCGGVAQLVEHLLCKQGVVGSNPVASISCGGSRAAGRIRASRIAAWRWWPRCGPRPGGLFFHR